MALVGSTHSLHIDLRSNNGRQSTITVYIKLLSPVHVP
jgi:hypothetical protein